MILQGNSIRIPLADNSVNCVITSPPYWNLRDYGTARWEGGSIDCDHKTRPSHNIVSSTLGGGKSTTGHWQEGYRDTCPRCGAVRIDNQIGLEPTIAEYIAVIVQVFREVKRVLHPTGIAWVNLGDTYATSRNGRSAADTKAVGRDDRTFRDKPFSVTELPAKNLCGIPWRVALALQDDGWILRSDIIWSKPNPMPESVNDRPTKSHEYIFMLTKEPYYFYDNEAIRENFADERMGNPGAYKWSYANDPETGRGIRGNGGPSIKLQTEGWNSDGSKTGRNRRTVWEIATQPYPAAHYATFPTALVRPMILAATSARGCCPTCGKQWARVSNKTLVPGPKACKTFIVDERDFTADKNDQGSNRARDGHKSGHRYEVETTGWQPTCSCNAGEPIPSIVLDPFTGSGTVGQVARELGRRFIGIDLSATYLIENALPRAEMKTSEKAIGQLPMFAQMESA